MTATATAPARFVRVTGVVQGVGFRPFIHRLATRLGLSGWVRNVAGTVEIHVEGPPAALDAFERLLPLEAPRVSRIDAVRSREAAAEGAGAFTISASADAGGNRPAPPDIAICAACEREMRDSGGRRFRHPFITCTDCGPRYSVIDSLPYDRERTSMAAFTMCDDCRAEYTAPGDRRFHAETVACNHCGPHAWFAGADGERRSREGAAVAEAAEQIVAGRIVAVRGVGGFHLACDATNAAAVARLRARKGRDAKPLAVMVANLEAARGLAEVTPEAERLLTGPERPIVLLAKREPSPIAAGVAPGIAWLGVMLPYTPLHHLLLEACGSPLVLTSGNLSDEPIAIGNDEARERLGAIADGFLLHDREILSRVDDSVVRLVDDAPLLLRRSRGYAPLPLRLPVAAPVPLLAVGPHLKNTFTLANGTSAFVSPHIGDLEGLVALAHFKSALARYRDLFRITPRAVVRDLHPGYLSTRIAAETGLSRIIAVQHHHAHIAAVLAEHGEAGPAVGIALDGTGYGDDGRVWGAEVMVASLTGYARRAHLRYAPLPGGDAAAREPWRAAAGYLSLAPNATRLAPLAFDGISHAHRAIVERQIERRINAPEASSMGRLFDAAAAILGVRRHAGYEGHAAMELESLAGARVARAFDIPVRDEGGTLVMDPLPMLVSLGVRAARGHDARDLAATFHESVIAAVSDVAIRVASAAGLGLLALGGGSFQNARLLSGVRARLSAAGLRVLVPTMLGPNDGAISYGQAAVGAAVLAAEGEAIP